MQPVITRANDVPVQDFGGVKLYALANPAQGAQHIVLRGLVAVGAEFPPHSHDHDEILVFNAGRAAYTIGEETGVVGAGDVVIVPAGSVHTFEALEDIDAVAILPAAALTFDPTGAVVEQRV